MVSDPTICTGAHSSGNFPENTSEVVSTQNLLQVKGKFKCTEDLLGAHDYVTVPWQHQALTSALEVGAV